MIAAAILSRTFYKLLRNTNQNIVFDRDLFNVLVLRTLYECRRSFYASGISYHTVSEFAPHYVLMRTCPDWRFPRTDAELVVYASLRCFKFSFVKFTHHALRLNFGKPHPQVTPIQAC